MENKKYADTYEFHANAEEQDKLFDEVKEMEENSEWRDGIVSKQLKLEAIEAPIFAMQAAQNYGLDEEIFMETSESTKLLLDYEGEKMLVRDTAYGSLCETAKLYGSALGRMPTPLLADTLNNGLTVARGNSLVLMRYGKASSIHSDAEGGYEVMPISKLLDMTCESIGRNFGDTDFMSGYNTHGYTSAIWTLPEKQDEILDCYQKALDGAVSRNFAVNWMPAVRFTTSDTSNSCATLTPIFVTRTASFSLVDGVSIRHSKRYTKDGKCGLELYRTEIEGMYAQFQSCAETIANLSKIEIRNGTNCVVSLCKRYNIPKKFGDAARELVEGFTIGGRSISAHDVYLAFTASIAEAVRLNAGWSTQNNLQEQIAKIATADWASHDVGGVVAW